VVAPSGGVNNEPTDSVCNETPVAGGPVCGCVGGRIASPVMPPTAVQINLQNEHLLHRHS